ncbi:MAG TPA: M1 family aminopeptidase [Flavobacteriales bacterium]|nr:hypothetical protein [Flavobacteriales bacterium]HRN35618.1 M1 family aminopeptidase [Flavobacteriales bacterium]HRO39281.1 M1 family aminopeptidase [Flavobacteriales bacterium]HRP81367.1 M1 family aminopeptidase [Flavobacteriales bacterium]HRQ84932.1 M1 family aminopeptidase [Flavobacteriales bacterium]
MRKNYLIAFSAVVMAVAGAHAQPFQYGCHYFRNHPSAPAAPTPAQRALIDDIIARSDTFDILHYDIAIDVTDYAGQQLKAATTVRFVPLMANQSFIRFELWDLQVDSVISSEGPLAFSQDTMHLRVNFPAPPTVGDTAELTVYYHGHPHRDPDWGGFYFESGYIYNLGIGIASIPPNFGKVWYPCFDSFVERATYTYHVKSAGTFRAHGQGDFLGEVQLGGDTVIRSFALDQPIPTHLSAIAVADYRDSNYVHTGAYGDVPVRLTAKPNKLAAMAAKMVDVGAAIDACQHWYGPYGWQRVGYVLTTDGALEIPTNIAYPDFMPSQSVPQNRALLTHELGHHWWGDMVTPRTQQDMWLKEGPAEYSGHLVEEWLGGPAAFVNAVKDNQLYVLKNAHIQDGGFQPLSPMPDPYIYGLTTYYKGAAVMHNLRGYLGDTLFSQGLQAVQAAHAYSTLDAAGFRDALETATGYDLHPFFTDQVFAPGFSVFVVQNMSSQPSGAEWSVDLQVRQKLRGTTVFHQQVPLDITLVGAQGQQQEYRMTVGGEYTELALACDFEPVMAVLNGHNRLNQARMDFERTLVPGTTAPQSQPRVDFQMYVVQLPDTALVRFEHIWAAPEEDLGTGIDEISGSHYWIVDGLWPEGTQLQGRLTYAGQSPSSLDHDLLGTDETGVMLLYRPDASAPWEIYADQTVSAGPLTNGSGYITLDVLRRGQYAFGKGTFVGVAEAEPTSTVLRVFPVPASERLQVSAARMQGLLQYTVYNIQGGIEMQVYRNVDQGGTVEVDISALAAGTYTLLARPQGGGQGARTPFVVVR